MSATSANALKALIEGLGLSLTAYRDEAKQGAAKPYVTITEEISFVPDSIEDGQATTGVETVTVDLWQQWKNSNGAGTISEDYTLAPNLRKGLHGKRLALIGTAITYVVLVRNSIRLLDPESNVVHHVLTLDIHREL